MKNLSWMSVARPVLFLSLLALIVVSSLTDARRNEFDEIIDPEFEALIEQRLAELRRNQLLTNQVETVPAHQQTAVYDAVAYSTTTPPDLSTPASPDNSIVIGPRPASAFTAACNGRFSYGELSHQRDNSFCYGPAPQGYKATIDPYLCLNMDQFFRSCPPFGNGSNFDACGMTSGSTWGPPGKASTTAWGTWTSWWKGLSAYCMQEGYWSHSDASRLPNVNSSASITFTIAGTNGETQFASTELRNDNQMVEVEGTASTSRGRAARTLTSPTFNSPFIYLKNQAADAIVKLSSVWNQYQSQLPAFNIKDGWEVSVGDETPLFYELGLKEVELTRAGRNFATKTALVDFLQASDFFDQLGFAAEEKNNSLDYLLPKLPAANYYYLTIMTPEAVEKISQTEVTPAPETLIRRYFAVYPTVTAVLAESDLDYPATVPDAGFTVRDYGEIIVTPEMFVHWQ